MTNTSLPRPLFHRLLLTGAAGGLGAELRQRLPSYTQVLRLSDRAELGTAQPHEEICLAELQDKEAVLSLLKDVDAVIHLGGISTEQPFDLILQANIVGAYNLYEAARKQGIKRVVFASSNHVTGFYKQNEVVHTQSALRPDCLYGVSKAFGENLAQFYYDRYGIETVSIRIGSSFPKPRDRRMLATWLSYDDLEQLLIRALTTPCVGHTIIYGVSDNAIRWWDNRHASHLGYKPKDSSDLFEAEVQAQHSLAEPDDPAALFQGGAFVRTGPFD
ncbi:NAD(P)-dependent oxidoreductase [Alcaligenes sp. 13f]|uniref:NAD-dependent epimerase/dehydratase family protein n=1 Tax=Alcaligenes sp. 13f TaxID=2841924 RepID=UPI001CF635AA|nr:NAD(P)-dependent oxidoreductase [Alcaligenes sp. 13f]MCB4321962.1 NAD(P)-dependent oxidoreductase [Alcaligenes sp. 13f]